MADDIEQNTNKEQDRLSPKEFARELRRKAYRRAKELQKTDPRFLAIKEKQRQARREAYQRVKVKKQEATRILKEIAIQNSSGEKIERDRNLLK